MKKQERRKKFSYLQRKLQPERCLQEAVAELRKEGLVKGELRSKRLEVSIEEQGAPWVRRLRSAPAYSRLWSVYLLVLIFAGLLAWHLISTPKNPPPRHSTASPAESAAPSQPQPLSAPPKQEPQPATPQVPQPSPKPPEPAPVSPPPVSRPSPSANAFLGVVKSGDLSTLRSLLDQGANPNAADENGATALMWAAKIGNLGIVKALIAKGADPKKKGVIYTDEKKQSWYGNFLCAAAGEDHEDIVRYGIEVLKIPVDDQEINPKDGTETGWTPLMWAAYKGHTDVCELLISKGADVNAKSNDGWTPLMYAALKGHKDVCELLISKGADVNAKDKDGGTPLMYAALKGHKDVCELLISKGADVNAKDKYGFTALMDAAKSGHKDVCELLISKGADINAQDKDGKTALKHAIEAKHTDVADFLRSKGATE